MSAKLIIQGAFVMLLDTQLVTICDVLSSQSLGLVLRKKNPTQQKHTFSGKTTTKNAKNKPKARFGRLLRRPAQKRRGPILSSRSPTGESQHKDFDQAQAIYRVSQKSEPLNILQQQPQICSDLNKILHTQDDICCKHYYVVSYKSALTLLKYEFLNNITHKS